jgi:hypothetical protein
MDADSLRAAAVTAKIEDGNITAAVRILCSDDAPADFSNDVYLQLKDKHPAGSTGPRSHPSPDSFVAYQATEAEVMRAVKSFPAGSAAGSDGLRPQHLLEMVTSRDAGPALLAATAAFANMLLDGTCHPDYTHIFFGGRLIALSKKSGGIRPIAIGCTWRRLAAKCACSFASEKLKSIFAPRQVGVAVKGGCEAAVHATRRFIAQMPPNHVVAKLDFSNAFNCLDRDHMLQQVADTVPEIYKFCHLSYDQVSTLQFGDFNISSEVGPQQGDPLGGLLFCLGVHPILRAASSTLTIGYMDDVTLGGPADVVASDVELFRSAGGKIGLVLNDRKCELITCLATTSENMKQFTRVDRDDASLLGAPISTGCALDTALEARNEDLRRAVGRLRTLPAHDALVLLRSSFSAPRLMHVLRCSPCHAHPALSAFDDLLREGVSVITNSRLTDMQWVQASLPIRDGGLGVRRATSLALPAFLASAASTATLQALILAPHGDFPDTAVDAARAAWCDLHTNAPPTDDLSASQRAWHTASKDHDKVTIWYAATSTLGKARHYSRPHVSDWLVALPISSCGGRGHQGSRRSPS